MPRNNKQQSRGRRSRGAGRNLRRTRRRNVRTTAPVDPRPFTPIKWQPLMIEFDLASPGVGWGAFTDTDIITAFQHQTGQADLNINFKCRKMDVWFLDNTIDLSAMIYNLTPELDNIAKQQTDVAGKNHWPSVRLPWVTKDRQQVLGGTSQLTNIGAVYFPAADNNARVRVSILWRFASQGSTPKITVKSKFVAEQTHHIIDNHKQEVDNQSSIQSTSDDSSHVSSTVISTASGQKIKRFSLRTILKHAEKTKPRFFSHDSDTPNYMGHHRMHHYVEFDCGACRTQQRMHLDGIHGHPLQKPIKLVESEALKMISELKKDTLFHECALHREKKKTIKKKQHKQTARSYAWSQTKSGSSVKPSDSVSNVQFNALVSEIADLKRIISSLRTDTNQG